MKKRLLLAALIVLMAAALSGCNVWEEKWMECTPLPEADGEIIPDPWDPDGTQTEPVGD